ncbi:hypothetical protein Sru01_58940 [Sphaerisporangium rufum]|uniref:AB hydrolase-1 domain-containing protein n=1 Tax=Sphaerisporangium rufum TaxID=1381558 RepID=A0A919R748_9ACTN|nr:alpha/beta hydrolase [Sphaerisporangium rufum]GII80912.1 hypothetical protein Sru01_58940 [Sphaerisporangium rufum]
MSPVTNTLAVSGATLHYEVRGSGPVLLLICGGVYDAAGYAGLAERLADRYTVVTYDRRGNSRSPLAGPPEPQPVETHGDDAARVLAAAGVTPDAPARVFGNSSGAIIGLELAARRPELVRVLVAHEPPLFGLLPERDHWREVMARVEEAFHESGPAAAHQVFGASLAPAGDADAPGDASGGVAPSGQAAEDGGPDGPAPDRIPGGGEAPQGEPDPETMAMLARLERNAAFFIGYEVPPFSRYVPDLTGLGRSTVPVVPAVGETSHGEPWVRATYALAEALDTEPVPLPGDHGGFGADPAAFAARLHEILATA